MELTIEQRKRRTETQRRWVQSEKGKLYLASKAIKESKFRSRANRNIKTTDFINQFKTSRGCFRCGYNKHPAALEFHHRNPEEKTANVSLLVKFYSFDRVIEEVPKCDILCSNCHRILEYEKGSD